MNKDKLEKIILETVDIPSLPVVAMKVLRLMSNDYSSVNELEKIISADQAFSTRLLKIANSPYYGRGRTIDTISTAVVLVGFDTMKNLVVAASMNDLHRKHGAIEQQLWEHSLGVSIAASLLAQETKLMQSEEALVAGLIHDVGKTILNNSMPEIYETIAKDVETVGGSFKDIEDKVLGFNHCTVGGLIARKWKLPKNLEVVMEYHHSEAIPAQDSGHETICKIVRIADAMCLFAGIGMKRQMEVAETGFELIGLSNKQFSTVLEKLDRTYNEQKSDLL